MVASVIRVLIGFALACVAAGATIVLFVHTPPELASEPAPGERLPEAAMLALAVATHTAKFVAPFALIAAIFAEWRQIGSWTYYVLVGVAIAVIGFLAQHASEGAGQASILNNYALSAFLATGFVGGFVYWLVSGRYAAPPRPPARPEIRRPPAPEVSTPTVTAPPPSPVPDKA